MTFLVTLITSLPATMLFLLARNRIIRKRRKNVGGYSVYFDLSSTSQSVVQQITSHRPTHFFLPFPSRSRKGLLLCLLCRYYRCHIYTSSSSNIAIWFSIKSNAGIHYILTCLFSSSNRRLKSFSANCSYVKVFTSDK